MDKRYKDSKTLTFWVFNHVAIRLQRIASMGVKAESTENFTLLAFPE